jgi:hypothetical protein
MWFQEDFGGAGGLEHWRSFANPALAGAENTKAV